MDYATLTIGALAVCYGVYTAVVRIFWPQKFSKLEPMKKRYGSGLGVAVHFVGYTLSPIAFGVFCFWLAYLGLSIFPR